MSVITSTGTTIAVSPQKPATFNNSGFYALNFSEIGEVTNIPEFGPSVQVVTHESLATGITQKHKGFINYGSVGLEAAYDSVDAGQDIMSGAVTGPTRNNDHSFRIEMSDGSKRYFYGKVFSFTENPSSANSMISSSMQLEINSPILKFPKFTATWYLESGMVVCGETIECNGDLILC